MTVSACEVVVSDEFQSVSNLLHTHDHVTLGVWIFIQTSAAGGRASIEDQDVRSLLAETITNSSAGGEEDDIHPCYSSLHSIARGRHPVTVSNSP